MAISRQALRKPTMGIALSFLGLATPIALAEKLPLAALKSANGETTDHWESYNAPTSLEVTEKAQVEDIVATPSDYTYASFGKPNPFIPPLLSNHLTTLEIPIVSILQRSGLDQLSVVGIWTLENHARKALILTPKNEGVIVTVGDPVGNRGGKIISIEPQVVKVREFTLTPDGTRQFEDHDLWLGNDRPKEEEKIIIRSKKVDSAAFNLSEGQDFLETTEKEKSRLKAIMHEAADNLHQPAEKLREPPKEAGLKDGKAIKNQDKEEDLENAMPKIEVPATVEPPTL